MVILYHTLVISVAVIFQVPHNCKQLHLLRLFMDSEVNNKLNGSNTKVLNRFEKRGLNR